MEIVTHPQHFLLVKPSVSGISLHTPYISSVIRMVLRHRQRLEFKISQLS